MSELVESSYVQISTVRGDEGKKMRVNIMGQDLMAQTGRQGLRHIHLGQVETSTTETNSVGDWLLCKWEGTHDQEADDKSSKSVSIDASRCFKLAMSYAEARIVSEWCEEKKTSPLTALALLGFLRVMRTSDANDSAASYIFRSTVFICDLEQLPFVRNVVGLHTSGMNQNVILTSDASDNSIDTSRTDAKIYTPSELTDLNSATYHKYLSEISQCWQAIILSSKPIELDDSIISRSLAVMPVGGEIKIAASDSVIFRLQPSILASKRLQFNSDLLSYVLGLCKSS